MRIIFRSHPVIMNGRTNLEDGIWTYSLEDIWSGLQDSYSNLVKDVKRKI